MEKRILLTGVCSYATIGIMDQSENFVHVPGFCGIYLLMRGDEVVYVGQSVNVYTRISSHYQTLQRHRKGLRPLGTNFSSWATKKVIIFNTVKIKICPKADLDKEELALIQHYQPKDNDLMKRPPRPEAADALRSMPLYKELMRQAELRKAKEERNKPMKKRRLPKSAYLVEKSFQQYRDDKVVVTLPKLKCLEDELTG